jgi:hypothetical protein
MHGTIFTAIKTQVSYMELRIVETQARRILGLFQGWLDSAVEYGPVSEPDPFAAMCGIIPVARYEQGDPSVWPMPEYDFTCLEELVSPAKPISHMQRYGEPEPF